MDVSQAGRGTWSAFDRPVEKIFEAAERWRRAIGPVQRPWLIWHVSDKWTILQQRLVQSVGWTPLLGRDPRASMPPVLDGAIYVDFNEDFGFPILYPFVVFEFAWLCVPSKLAFWHSDLLCRLETMKRLADVFEKLKQGETAAVYDMRGRRNLFFRRRHRYWELVGCTTVGAGRDQYETGTGWWRNFADHPMCKDEAERCRRRKHYWDHGSGILYWKRQYGGRVVDIPLDLVREGHCTSINRKDYVIGHGSKKNIELPTDLDANYDVLEVAKRLGIAHLLD